MTSVDIGELYGVCRRFMDVWSDRHAEPAAFGPVVEEFRKLLTTKHDANGGRMSERDALIERARRDSRVWTSRVTTTVAELIDAGWRPPPSADAADRYEDLRYNLSLRAFTAPDAQDEEMLESLDARIRDACTPTFKA